MTVPRFSLKFNVTLVLSIVKLFPKDGQQLQNVDFLYMCPLYGLCNHNKIRRKITSDFIL